ncbi:MAG: FAD-dependent oxidoreductase [Variovorax sp.]
MRKASNCAGRRASPTAIHCEVLVVGGGASGLSAAIEAARAGASTLLLEKCDTLGGSSGLSVGSINAAGSAHQRRSGILDSPDAHFADMDHYTAGYAPQENHELRRLLVDNAAGTLAWLDSLGLSFFGPTADPPNRQPRMHNVLPNSKAYPYFMGRAARAAGVETRLGARVVELLVAEDDGVRGVRALVGGETVDFLAARATVLATGDYSNGVQLKKRFRPELAEVPGVNPAATGDGHHMAEAIGARVVNGNVIFGPSLRLPEPKKTNLLRRVPPSKWLGALMSTALHTLPMRMFRPFVMSFMTASLGPEASLLHSGALLLNVRGGRIDPGQRPPGLAIAQTPEGQAWLLLDAELARKFSAPPHHVSTAPGVAFAYLPDYRRHRPDVYRCADTLTGIEREMNLPAGSVAAAVEEHRRQRNDPVAMARGPYHALGPVESRVVITDGGLAVTTDHQVLGPHGRVIPRLFAAGAVGQGGALLAGNGHHIAWAVTSGRRAGQRAASSAAQVNLH